MACPSNEAAGVVEVDRLGVGAEGACGRVAILIGLADTDSAHHTHPAAVESLGSAEHVLSRTPDFATVKEDAKH